MNDPRIGLKFLSFRLVGRGVVAVLLIFNHVRGSFKVLLVKLHPICVAERREERVVG